MRKKAETTTFVQPGNLQKVHRSDLTLPPTVVEAAVLHAKSLQIPQVEYFRLAVETYFKHCLLEPPTPVITRCLHCGTRLREPRSSWKRLRMSTRLDPQTRNFLRSLAEDYYACNWSRAFEAATRHYLGDRDPPLEGQGQIPGVRLKSGPKTESNPGIKKTGGRRIESVEGMIRKLGGS